MIDINKLKQKLKRDDPVIKRAKEITEWYRTHDIPAGDKRIVIDKLRAEYEKEAGELNQKQARELQPLAEEYEKRVAVVRTLQKQASDMGKRHEQEHKDLSRKYVEMELTILRGGGIA